MQKKTSKNLNTFNPKFFELIQFKMQADQMHANDEAHILVVNVEGRGDWKMIA